MKRKILSFSLILLFIPAIFLFSACGDKSYKLANLKTDFYSIANSCQTIKLEDNKFDFDYLQYTYNDETVLANLLTSEPYAHINSYNAVFNGVMGFTYDYIGICSSDNIEVPKEFRDELKVELDNLQNSLKLVDNNTKSLVELLKANSEDVHNTVCLNSLGVLFGSYDSMLVDAVNFSDKFSQLYFDYALSQSNTDYSKMPFNEFDAGMVVGNIKARTKWQESNIYQLFVEIEIDGKNLPKELINKDNNYGSFDLTSIQTQVAQISISSSFNVNAATSSANNHKTNFYYKSIELFNIQSVLKDEFSMFMGSSNAISYNKVKAQTSRTAEEEMNLNQINTHAQLLKEYNKILSALKGYMGV